MSSPDVLIEDWFPIETIGCESMRDASAARKPPLNRLHVWWARRPLTASRAALLASVLPSWSDRLSRFAGARELPFRSAEEYGRWFLRLCGIFGDPVAGRAALAGAREAGKWIKNPYTHDRAYTVNPSSEMLEALQHLLRWTWGKQQLALLDPFSGGGAIPFEATRYGFNTEAVELNPVACSILRGTLDYPFALGPSLGNDIREYGRDLVERLQARLRPVFSDVEDDARTIGVAYLWARTVLCPYTGKPIPLAPNWWLSRSGSTGIAARPICDADSQMARFEIVDVNGTSADGFDPTNGTVRRGTGRSP